MLHVANLDWFTAKRNIVRCIYNQLYADLLSLILCLHYRGRAWLQKTEWDQCHCRCVGRCRVLYSSKYFLYAVFQPTLRRLVALLQTSTSVFWKTNLKIDTVFILIKCYICMRLFLAWWKIQVSTEQLEKKLNHIYDTLHHLYSTHWL